MFIIIHQSYLFTRLELNQLIYVDSFLWHLFESFW